MKKNKLIIKERDIKNNQIVGEWEMEFDTIEETLKQIAELDKGFARTFFKFEYQIIEIRD